MQIEYIKVSDLKPYENNPRKNDSSVDKVAASIQEFGFKVPIVVDKDNLIVCGHTRWKAARKIGMEEVPCVRADDLSEEQIKAFRLADNKVGESSTWDEDMLKLEIGDLPDIVLDTFGGSGTTIMACEQDGRKGYCMELDPKYVDVIIDRWEKFTGSKAEKLEG